MPPAEPSPGASQRPTTRSGRRTPAGRPPDRSTQFRPLLPVTYTRPSLLAVQRESGTVGCTAIDSSTPPPAVRLPEMGDQLAPLFELRHTRWVPTVKVALCAASPPCAQSAGSTLCQPPVMLPRYPAGCDHRNSGSRYTNDVRYSPVPVKATGPPSPETTCCHGGPPKPFTYTVPLSCVPPTA